MCRPTASVQNAFQEYRRSACELLLAQQKTVGVAATVQVGTHDVALRIDPKCSRLRPEGRRYVDGEKLALAQQKTMRVAAAVQLGTHDVASRIDPKCSRKPRSARYIDFRELRLSLEHWRGDSKCEKPTHNSEPFDRICSLHLSVFNSFVIIAFPVITILN
jgi:hypothetical protein